ncbi:protein MIZU-KUSSEI 1-like [Malania oleifera]|uniref:protein MIZU-KUSSEI 1-like n=1 Tax=Malania oleifera TaxID=397392 RepID=UPI0025AE6DBD|nr:protein MIZU-KUSSEI 1-like [Malania oleifera]
MRTIMADSSQDFSSRRHFHWTKKVSNEEDEAPPLKPPSHNPPPPDDDKKQSNDHKTATPEPPASAVSTTAASAAAAAAAGTKKKLPAVAVSRLRSVLTAFGRNKANPPPLGLGTRVVGTLFGHRRGHVHFAFQREPSSPPAFLIELATPISGLVHEMASGLVRIALECDKEEERKGVRLLEEPLWRTYCNAKKCGFASRRECGPKEWKVLKAVEPISMGAGVLPAASKNDADGEVMYMRAKFERVVGSRDSEAFYMMNPDNNGAPELSIYLLRV